MSHTKENNKFYDENLTRLRNTYMVNLEKLKREIAELELKNVHLIHELHESDNKVREQSELIEKQNDVIDELQNGFIEMREKLKNAKMSERIINIDSEYLS